MDKFRKILKRLVFLPPGLTVLIAAPAFAFVFVMLNIGSNYSILTYSSYFLSAYGLLITVAGFADLVEAVRRGIVNLPLTQKIRSVPVGARYLDDPVFRAEVSLYGGLFINLLYVGVKLASGIYYHSLWFIALSAYYVFLSTMRFLLLRHVRSSPIGQEYESELRCYRLCGKLLIVMNVALSAIVALVVVWNQGFKYGGYLIYVMAIYAFYSLITSITNTIKFRKYNSPVLSAAKVIDLTAAFVSMLSLETAMLSRFGAGEPEFRRVMTAATGSAVCILVLGMAVYMIIRARKKLKQRKL